MLLLGTIALLPLAYARGITFDFFNMPKLTLLFVVVSITMGLRGAEWMLTARPFETRGLWIPAGAVAIPMLLAWTFSSYKVWSLVGFYTRYSGLLPYLATICLALLIIDAFVGKPGAIAVAFAIGASLVGTIAILQMLFQGASIGTESDTAYVTSTLGHSNFAGGYLAIGLPIALTLWIKAGDRRASIAAAIATASITLGLLFTFSQGGWAGAAAGVAFSLGLMLRDKARIAPKIGAGVAVSIAAVSIGVVIAGIAIPHSYERFPGPLKTAVSRGFLWETAVSVAKDSPLVGVGPNVFAIEGTLNRPLEAALLRNFTKGDDPHSVPLAMLANTGLLGLAGYFVALTWGLSAIRKRSQDTFGIAFGGSLIAYTVQAFASIDEISLRFAFWIVLAGLGVIGVRAESGVPTRAPLSRRLLASLLVLASMLLAALAVRTFLVADRHVALALDAIERQDPAEASREFRAAIDLRADTEYRRLYAGSIGNAAISQGLPEGRALIAEMRQAFDYLDSFPDPQAMSVEGELFYKWSAFEPAAADEALQTLERARKLDPNNPLLGVLIADVLIRVGDYEEAIAELEPHARVLTEEFPEYLALYYDLWADLAIAQTKAGRDQEASDAFARTGSEKTCRKTVAAALLQGETERPPIPPFLCPQVLIDLVTPTGQSSDR